MRHWLACHKELFPLDLDLDEDGRLGIHSLYSCGSTRPCLTRIFWLAANTLKQVWHGEDLPHSSQLSLLALSVGVGKTALGADLSGAFSRSHCTLSIFIG